MDKLSVRRRQIDEVSSMINYQDNTWKVLIYDTIGRDIIAPLFTINELKNFGVIIHSLINSDRESMIDVSAVYFVVPTDVNIERIRIDIKNQLYSSYYLNFISPISGSKLDSISDTSLLSNTHRNFKNVVDRYLNFIALEDDLFILRENDKHLVSYYAINRNDATDSQISFVIDLIVECLFSLLVTLNIIPIIRCPKGGAAECIAEKLTKKVRETLRDSRNSLFDNKELKSGASALGLSFQRPLLCLVDRTIDMSTPLHHTWTYQALIHDLLNIKLNNVQVIEDKDKPKPKKQFFNFNSTDKFWFDQRGSPFPQVAEAVQQALDDYRRHEDEVKNLKASLGLDDTFTGIATAAADDETTALAESAAKLNNAVSSLPELLENKRVIGMHTTIATTILDEIKARKLDNFFEIEEKIMNRNLIDRATLDEMLSDKDYGEPNDKYRLFLICYICDNPSLTDDEAEKYVTILEELGCKRTAFEYIQRWKTFSKINVASLQSSLQSSSGVLKTAGMFSKLMSQGSSFVMEGVKNLVLKEHYLPLTKVVDSLMDSSSKVSQEALDYAYYDPKALKDNDVQRKRVFSDAIVFVVGGGNYIEYQNLVEYSKSKSRSASGAAGSRHVIYGSTHLVNGSQFLQELEYACGI